MMLKIVLVFGLVVFVTSADAQMPDTCQGMFQKCKAECPAAVAANPQVPKDCTCSSRFATCKQTKSWPSWDGVRSRPMKG
jgi:hypothetical protein